jgi:hypothetical protein
VFPVAVIVPRNDVKSVLSLVGRKPEAIQRLNKITFGEVAIATSDTASVLSLVICRLKQPILKLLCNYFFSSHLNDGWIPNALFFI